ncbi:hypothetical protein EDD36DRAFT_468962 [Exophiala viscosa]|uniref:Uncharacterized protein n=1 Tax=Exophiala viscosa TaxID=2486360 RepID=A0AAN6DQ31_9EURO|nr:hypothetical protein EDD36DRAFT_468962 [Exophiala viscosa]
MSKLLLEEPRPKNTFVISTAEAKLRISTQSNRIFTARDKISQILYHKESRLQQRWAKKSKDKRFELLQAAWPEIPSTHGVDIQATLEAIYPPKGKPPRPLESDAVYKWPWMNLEDLAHARNLPLLLNSRARTNPDVFAHADLAATEVGRNNGKIKGAWLPGQLMVFMGRTTPETYGALTHWEENDYKKFYLWLGGVHFDVASGLATLEIQSKIYEFLLDCCYLMFSDVPQDELLRGPVLLCTESAQIWPQDTTYLNLATVVAEAPFRVPDTLDTNQLLQLIGAKRAAAEDHAWSIKEDPGYFLQVLLSRAKHRPENLREWKGKKPGPESECFWNDVINAEIHETYRRLSLWDILYEGAQVLYNKAPKGFSEFDHQELLPQDVDDAAMRLLFFAEFFAMSFKNDLSMAVSVSEQGWFDNILTPDPEGLSIVCIGAQNSERLNDPLMMLFMHLFDGHRTALKQVGLHKIVDEIQRKIEKDPKQAQRLSPFVSDGFSELALVANICRVLEGIYPWGFWFNQKLREMDNTDSAQVENFARMDEIFKKDGKFPTGAAESRLDFPIKDSLNYPIHKAYNEHNVAILRRSEWNLDLFWRRWDCLFHKNMGETLNDILRRYSKGTRVINRTLPFRPHEGRETTSWDSMHQLVPDTAKLAIEPQTSGRFTAESPRVKIKTRKAQVAPEANVQDNVAEPITAAEPVVKFKLKERALTVFRSLFHTREAKCQRREVNWKDFLHAMTKIGFRAEKLYGSVWHFIPEGLDVTRSLQVHEPHPGNEIPHFMARYLGRRLTHTYGWTGEDFGEI